MCPENRWSPAFLYERYTVSSDFCHGLWILATWRVRPIFGHQSTKRKTDHAVARIPSTMVTWIHPQSWLWWITGSWHHDFYFPKTLGRSGFKLLSLLFVSIRGTKKKRNLPLIWSPNLWKLENFLANPAAAGAQFDKKPQVVFVVLGTTSQLPQHPLSIASSVVVLEGARASSGWLVNKGY